MLTANYLTTTLKIEKMTHKYGLKLNKETGVLTRFVDPKKHFFRKYQSYAFDKDRLQAYFGKYHTLQIRTNTGNIYSISFEDLEQYHEHNTDYGKHQIFINVKYLELIKVQNMKTIRLDEITHSKLKEKAKKSNMTLIQYIRLNVA